MWRLLAPGSSFLPLVLLSPPDPPGGGGNDDDDLDDPPPIPATVAGDAALALRDYRDQTGTWLRKQRRVVAGYRGRARTAEETLATERQERAQATVLTADEAKVFEAFKALGKPDDVKAAIAERDTLAAEVATARKDGTLRDVATAAGFDFDVLKQLGGDREYELRDVTVEGQTQKQPFIKDGDTAKPLDEFAQAAWAKFLPSLKATQEGGQGGQSGGNGQRQGGGQFIPAMQGSGGQKPLSGPQVASNYVTNTYPGPPKRG